MNREFLVNIIFVIGINLLIKPFYIFGIDRTVQNVVGPETYGLYFALLNLTYILEIINDFGIQNYNNRNIAQHRQLLDKYLFNFIFLKLSLGLLYLFLTFGVAFALGYEWAQFHLLFWLIVNQFLLSMILFFRSNISGLGLYWVDSLISSLDKFLMILICGYFLISEEWRSVFQIEWFVYFQTISLLIAALIASGVIYSKINQLVIKFRLAVAWSILKKSWPFALIIILMNGYTRLDSIMIERLLENGEKEAGIYASAYRILHASNMIGFLFAGLLLPMFSRLLKEEKPVKSLLELSFRLMWWGSVTLSAGTFFFRNEISTLLYTNSNEYWGLILGWLMLSFIAVGLSFILATLLTAHDSIGKLNYLFGASVLLNFLLNWWLIPIYFAKGAVFATLITQFIAVFGQIYFVKKIFPEVLSLALWGKALTLAGIIFSITGGIYIALPLRWEIALLLSFFISLLISLIFRWLNVREFGRLIRE